MTTIKIDEDLLDGIENFVADHDNPPKGRMTHDEAVNTILRDWLMGQGYLAIPGDEEIEVVTAMDAAEVPK